MLFLKQFLAIVWIRSVNYFVVIPFLLKIMVQYVSELFVKVSNMTSKFTGAEEKGLVQFRLNSRIKSYCFKTAYAEKIFCKMELLLK